MDLLGNYSTYKLEAGCDEAGRGCLAGPVFASAVILPIGYSHPLLRDSKSLKLSERETARLIIERNAIAWAVAYVDNTVVDEMNILWASVYAMQLALDKLSVAPEFVIIDGNHFKPYKDIPFQCIVRGDSQYLSIASASILAKTHRDEYMQKQHLQYPCYGWNSNKGYPTPEHARAIHENGLSPLHRRSFSVPTQTKIQFED